MSKEDQSTIVTRVKNLCFEMKHSEAIALTNHIENKHIAIKAHLLCIEHEKSCRVKGLLPMH